MLMGCRGPWEARPPAAFSNEDEPMRPNSHTTVATQMLLQLYPLAAYPRRGSRRMKPPGSAGVPPAQSRGFPAMKTNHECTRDRITFTTSATIVRATLSPWCDDPMG